MSSPQGTHRFETKGLQVVIDMGHPNAEWNRVRAIRFLEGLNG